MKIYTKKGDQGKTELLGGTKVNKNNIRLECYGTIDELNAFIGNLSDQKIESKHKKTLIKIQNQLFNLGSNISCDNEKTRKILPLISEKDVLFLENEIDKIESMLPILKNFILPSGDKTASKCHIARTVCKRAERNLVNLLHNDQHNTIYISYLNRLSDYLFVLSRDILKFNNAKETFWQKNI